MGHVFYFAGEGGVVFGAVAVGFVFEDAAAIAGRFGEFDVAADAGVKEGDAAPRGVLILLLGEELFDIAGNFAGK